MNITCSALPESLLESELFGHERGAFTGADRQKRGLFEMADGGTVFLDEIGEMVPLLQAKLLRVLEERAFKRVGGATDIHVDVRVISATNRNLQEEVRQGKFRDDLFYRLNVLPIALPALAARTDLPALVERILARLARSEPMPRRIAADVLDAFTRHRWPGNLRQMTNVLRTAGMLAEDEAEITLAHLPDDFWLDCDEAPAAATAAPAAPAGTREGPTLQSHQAAVIDAALARHGGNVSAAARELGLARNTVYRHLRRH